MNLKSTINSRQAQLVFWTLMVGSVTAAAMTSRSNLAQGGQGRKSTDPPIASKGKLCQDLFLAIDHRDTAGVEALLSKGADPNSRNGLEFTPLYIAAASYQPDVMKALLKAGANPDAESNYGTPLTFAALSGNAQAAKSLIDLKVDCNASRTDGMTVLMAAANTGNPEIVGELLKHKVDINAEDGDGVTALGMAARSGNTKVAEMLLGAGAKVDATDSHHQTPLMAAAKNGHADLVRLLLTKGADVNAKDDKGMTALMLAAKYADNPQVGRELVLGGANPKATDAKGRTAAMFASTKTMRTPDQAVRASLKLLQSSMKEFTADTTCVSCHQEGLGRIAVGAAHDHGFSIDNAVQQMQMARLDGGLNALKPLHEGALKNPEVMKQVPLIEINEVTTGDAWLLSGMAAHHQPRTEANGAMAMVLARQQSPNGSWTFSVPRVPMQSSFFTFTALAVRSLNAYGPKSDAKEIAERVAHARAWLLKAEPKDSEDRASRLLGLLWSGASRADIVKAALAVRADQRADGGWAQLPNLHSDAYATGQALYALHEAAGMPVSDPVYSRGVKYLLRTQDDDGSWFVNKRAMPLNNYFDAGFPHGESQYASFNGTCWAMMALAEAVPAKHQAAR